MLKTLDRAAPPADAPAKSRRIIMLRATWGTQEKLREWAQASGFDLSWSYSGWPQSSWDFDFHVTIVASENEVAIPDGIRYVDTVTLTPIGYGVLGVDRRIPVIRIDAAKKLDDFRAFFISAFGITPTFPDFRPHISLSYKWDGEPQIEEIAPALPDFPLEFDALMVAQISDEPAKKTKDATSTRRIMSAADKATITGTRKTKDGYLVTEARVARGGNIQDYMGFEIGAPETQKIFKVWRPEDEVFKSGTLQTFAHRPVTMGHPPEGVTADNWRKEAVGMTGSEVVRDGEFVRVPMMISDAEAIAAIEAGTREISMGYDCELVMEAGTTPDGRAYDAFQRNHRMNHAAIVEAGRAGPQCRIGDQSRTQPQKKESKTMKTVTIDGKAHEVADDVAVHIERLQADAAKTADTLKAAGATLDAAQKALADAKAEAEASKKKADDAISALPTADKLIEMASSLSDAQGLAKKIAPDVDLKGLKTADDVRKAAVAKKLGDDAVKDRSADYIAATFDHLAAAADAASDPLAAIVAAKAGDASAPSDARKKYLDETANAWKH